MLLFVSVVCFGQDISVVKVEQVTDLKEGTFYFPQFSPDGLKLLFALENYKGLYLYDLKNRVLKKLNDYTSVGYKPSFSEDGSKVIFKASTFKAGLRYSSLIIHDIASKEETIIEREIRGLSNPFILPNNLLMYSCKDELKLYNIHSDSREVIENLDKPVVYNEELKIIVYRNGVKKIIKPAGPGNYIWISQSPDGTRILFTVSGKGTYICDLEGKILVEFGENVHAPKWSSNGEWIVYMDDKDDGVQYTSSEIWVVSIDGKKKVQLTDTKNVIEMYPVWSPMGDKIAFHSNDGKIHVMHLNSKKEMNK